MMNFLFLRVLRVPDLLKSFVVKFISLDPPVEPADARVGKKAVLYPLTPFDIHLSWFGAEDEGRTEEPTEHKIRKAREEGKVAKSMDLVSSLILLFSIITIALLGSYFVSQCMELISYFLTRVMEIDVTKDRTIVVVMFNYFIKLSLPVLLVCFIIGFVANVAQVGFVFSAKPITPSLDKIIPHFGKFFKRAMFSVEAAFNLGKSIFKIVIISLIVAANLFAEIGRINEMLHLPILMSFAKVSSIIFNIVVESAIAMIALSLVDYFFQRRQHLESLKMSVQETKEERKTYEGDPLIKSRLKQRMQEILTKNMISEVPKADVVITNPTHFAIGLKWDKLTMSSPTVIAKGVDHMAQRIKDVAFENSVPIIENKPLAQALWKEVDIGESIPEKFYEVVAIVIAEVYKLAGRTREAV
jgi:flagellar biosynthetic protein FlhB